MDDDPATSAALRSIFARRGWEVQVAGTLAEAVELHAARPWPESLILDLMLPSGDRVGVLQTIRDGALPIRVAVTNGSNDPERLRRVVASQPDLFHPKPIQLQDLLKNFNGTGPRED